MKYLEMTFSDEEKNQSSGKERIAILLPIVDLGLNSKEPIELEKAVEEMDASSQKLAKEIMSAKTDSQDKAIVSALNNRYPKIPNDKNEIKEFKEHLNNMLTSSVLSDGAMKYLIELILLKKGEQPKPQPKPPVQKQLPPKTQPEAPVQAAPQEGGTGSAPEAKAQETNNSDMNSHINEDDYYSQWDRELSGESSLTEDDFADILGEKIENLVTGTTEIMAEDQASPLRSSEDRKNAVNALSPAAQFAKSKAQSGVAKNEAYSGKDKVDGFTLAATFLINKEKEYAEMYDRDYLESSQVNKEKELTPREAASAFLNAKFKVKSNGFVAKSVHYSMLTPSVTSVDEGSHIDMGDEEIVLLKNKARSFATDIRGNLITRKSND